MATLIAKYVSKCYVCSNFINPGDTIVIDNNKPAIHKNCPVINKIVKGKFRINNSVAYCSWCGCKLYKGEGELWNCMGKCKQHNDNGGLHVSCIDTEKCALRMNLQKKGV